MAVTDYNVPITPGQNQSFSVFINGATYNFRLLFVDAPNVGGRQMAGWQLDIYDQVFNPLVLGLSLVTGLDLLRQFAYLGFNFKLFCYTLGNPSVPPAWANLGVQALLTVEF